MQPENNTIQRELLRSDEAERNVLGVILAENEYLFRNVDRLDASLFNNPLHRRVYEVICAVAADGGVADIVSVHDRMLRRPADGDPEPWQLAELLDSTIFSAFTQQVELLREICRRRRLWALGQRMIAAGTSFTVDIAQLEREMDRLRAEGQGNSVEPVPFDNAMAQLAEVVKANTHGNGAAMLPTGYGLIDERGGFHSGDFNVIAAESSQGKTTLAVNMSVNMARNGIPVLYFSLEMSSVQLTARIAAQLAGIPPNVIMYKKMYGNQLERFDNAARRHYGWPLYFDEEGTGTFEAILGSIRANVRKLGIKVFFIDYLQILSAVGRIDNTEKFLGDVSRRLKNVARQENVCIVALSQLNRAPLNPRPNLGRLRASGQIAEAADTVVFIFRESEYGKTEITYNNRVYDAATHAEMIIGKGRNIGTGGCLVEFDRGRGLFRDMEGHGNPLCPASARNGAMPAGNAIDTPF